jgi:hypothetical protein
MVRKLNNKNKTKKKNRINHNKSSKITGGVGAWSFGEHVYGNSDNQQTIDGPSNTIKTISGSTYMPNPDNYSDKIVVDGVTGGKKKQTGGRGIITELAIPAVLLYANNTIGKKIKYNKSKRNKTKRVRFSRKNKK